VKLRAREEKNRSSERDEESIMNWTFHTTRVLPS
jgi:hypothetical protein